MWSRVLFKPYLETASFPSRNPSPYADDVSDSIWCLKNSPSFFSKSDRLPFFEDVEEEEDDEGDEEEDEAEDEDVEATPLPVMEYISESNHIWANTWHMPSSTSGFKLG